jgi:hypothetical protein
VIERYLAELQRELAARGVRGRGAARILDEARDHLLELGSVEPFGPADRIAAEVAAQLAATRTVRSTYGAFVGLALTAAMYLAFMAFGGAPDLFSARHEAVGVASALGLVLFPQIAFVAGCLALLRALRRRGDRTSGEELGVIRSRAWVALGAGALTALSMAVWTVEYHQAVWLLVFPLLAVPVLAFAALAVAQAGEIQAVSGGAPGDVFDDLGFRMDPWPFAFLVAALIGLLGFVGGWAVEGDPGSGLVRGGFEGVAVLACFIALGRRLALRR